jgi:hypothetical protein
MLAVNHLVVLLLSYHHTPSAGSLGTSILLASVVPLVLDARDSEVSFVLCLDVFRFDFFCRNRSFLDKEFLVRLNLRLCRQLLPSKHLLLYTFLITI